MTKAPFRRISLLLLAGFALALTASGGCSRMSEGERCDFINAGDQDCDDGLECVPADQLVNAGNGADRCCPPATQSSSDSRCQRAAPMVPAAGGSSGAGGTGGTTAGAAGESMGGTPSGGEGGQPPGAMAGDGGMSSAGMSSAGMSSAGMGGG